MAFTRRNAPVVHTPDFAEQCEDLRQGIERDQEGVRVAMHELTGAAGSKVDVTEYIRRFPLTWAIGALLVGVWLGSRRASGDAAGQRRS
jgi:hypothetical protein